MRHLPLVLSAVLMGVGFFAATGKADAAMSALSLDRPATGAESPVEKAGYYRRWGHYGYGPYYYRPYYRPYYASALLWRVRLVRPTLSLALLASERRSRETRAGEETRRPSSSLSGAPVWPAIIARRNF